MVRSLKLFSEQLIVSKLVQLLTSSFVSMLYEQSSELSKGLLLQLSDIRE